MTKLRIASLKKDIKTLCDKLRVEGVDFSMAFIFGATKHDSIEHINANDDHHVLDMLNNQLQLWTKLNHKGK